VVVHHVVGKLDTTEKLEQKQLSVDKLKAVVLPKGNYFEVVEGHDQAISRAASVSPKKNPEKPKKDSLAELSKQLRALNEQVKTVEAQNQRLQDEMNAPERQKTAQVQPVEEQAGNDSGIA
jgi:endo-alpha-1,4-polygalactosaminidase (GH114 family)